ILVSIIVLSFMGETLNVMTLGGMALAVGILVDDATVEIENIHRNLHMKKRLVRAILDGAQQIAVPAFVATLCICIVFVPVVFISGAAKFLFTPLAMAVVFAMMTSYLLSRTLVPTMVHYLLAGEVEMYGGELDPRDPHALAAIHRKEAIEHHQPVPEEDEDLCCKREHLLCKTWFRALIVGFVALVAGLVFAVIKTPLGQQFPTLHGWLASNWHLLVQLGIVIVLLALAVWTVNNYDLIWRTHHAFNRQFEKLRRFYG